MIVYNHVYYSMVVLLEYIDHLLQFFQMHEYSYT